MPGTAAHARILELAGRPSCRASAAASSGRPSPTRRWAGRSRSPTSSPASARSRRGARGAPPTSCCARTGTAGRGPTRIPTRRTRALPVPGANDGASGVAVLLEVAELMSRRPPPVAVDLVFFDGEDLGSAGAPEGVLPRLAALRRGLWPAARSRARRSCSTWSGTGTCEIHPEVQSAERAANLVALVLEGARATGATAFRRDPRHAITDDHVPLLEAGVPAVDIIDFDYPAWHTHRDLPDQTSAGQPGPGRPGGGLARLPAPRWPAPRPLKRDVAPKPLPRCGLGAPPGAARAARLPPRPSPRGPATVETALADCPAARLWSAQGVGAARPLRFLSLSGAKLEVREEVRQLRPCRWPTRRASSWWTSSSSSRAGSASSACCWTSPAGVTLGDCAAFSRRAGRLPRHEPDGGRAATGSRSARRGWTGR